MHMRAVFSLPGPRFNGYATGWESSRIHPKSKLWLHSVSDSDGVYLVPAFSGLGAPHWDSHARGTIVGITRGTNRAHLARATLEGIAFQVADVLDAMQNDAGSKIQELRVDGGAAQNNLLMQFQADIMQTPVVRPQITETTAMGAAYLAGLSTGFFPSLEAIESVWRVERRFEPSMSQTEVKLRRETLGGSATEISKVGGRSGMTIRLDRNQSLDSIAGRCKPWDVAVIGGGANRCCNRDGCGQSWIGSRPTRTV